MLNAFLRNSASKKYAGMSRLTARSGMMLSLFLVFFAIAIGDSGVLFAQTDPFGEIDSVTVSDGTVRPKESVALQVNLKNDEELAGFTISLQYPSSLVDLDSVSYSSSRAFNWTLLSSTVDESAGTVTLNGVAVTSPALPAGDGELAVLHFTALAGLADGASGLVSTYTGGILELNTPNSISVIPTFSAGEITINATNRVPQIKPIAPLTVMEGETVTIPVETSDPDDDEIELFATNLTPGSVFENTARNQGTFIWQVPYVGPGSATHSPYNLEIVAFDGKASTRLTVPVQVVNVNRSPSISIGTDLSGPAGDELFVPFAGTDPDFDALSFVVEGLPEGLEINTGNPGFIRWNSAIEDSGDYDFSLSAIDENGGIATEYLTLQLLPSAPVEMTITEEQAFPGEFVDVYIKMLNRVSIAAFNVAVEFDKSILSINKIDTIGTRLDQWSTFSYTLSSDGKIFITADADNANPATNYLAAGDGPVVHLRFALSSSTQFAGFHTRIEYVFADPQDETENAAYEPDGTLVPKSSIEYTTGGVLVKKYDGLVGDINLNGVAFEIADLVYFTNYFVDPFQYPLDGARWQNSDINQNGVPGELADLVMMIQIVSGSSGKLAAAATKAAADYLWNGSRGAYSLRFDGAASFAVALFTFGAAADNDFSVELGGEINGFELLTARHQDQVRALVISRDGEQISVSDAATFLEISSGSRVTLASAEFIGQDGESAQAHSFEKEILPEEFTLQQNYPNPFNPETTISFDIPGSSQTRVEVFNILGEKISTLVDKVLPAGRHQVIFTGQNRSGQELPSGIYFYRLRTDSFEATRKMILLK